MKYLWIEDTKEKVTIKTVTFMFPSQIKILQKSKEKSTVKGLP